MKRAAPRKTRPYPYLQAILACLATTLITLPLPTQINLANIVMVFLLAVVLVAVTLGSGPAVLAAILSVALFDVFFVPPRFSFAVADAQYLITFLVMLIVALITGQLTARLRAQALGATEREVQTLALYEMARELAGALDHEQVADSLEKFLRQFLNVDSALYLPDQTETLLPVNTSPAPNKATPHIDTVYRQGKAMTLAAEESGYIPALALPVQSRLATRGVLLVLAPDADGVSHVFSPTFRPLLETVASLAAIAVERLHFAEVAQNATLAMASERLRSTLLSAISHDLRTPLTILVGLADSLAGGPAPLPDDKQQTAIALRDQALWLSGLVHKLLDMARFQVGKAKLNREWQPLEEVIGASIRDLGPVLAQRDVSITLAADLPLLNFDAVLIERVLCNLLENAAKYAPQGTIGIHASRHDQEVEVAITDQGPGLPAGSVDVLFELFERGQHEATTTGVGLGLAICRAIIQAHGGSIGAETLPQGGARVYFRLPCGEPPLIEEEA